MSSYTKNLLYTIADKMGRKREDLTKFIKIFEDNWYDTQEAFKKLQLADYSRMEIPEALAKMIMEAVGNEKPKMEIESPITISLTELQSRLPKEESKEIIETLSKVFTNIRQNLIEEKYRTLNGSKTKVAALAKHKEAVRVLKEGGFIQKHPGFVMEKVSIENIDHCIEQIEKHAPKETFNPYAEHISSIGTNIQQYDGESSVKYNDMLEELEKYRTKVMSQPVKDRKIKVYQVEPAKLGDFDKKFNEVQQDEAIENKIYSENIKQALKKMTEQPKFINRRMKEYLQLEKSPVYSQTIVRVKMPDNWVFQCTFAPLETLKQLTDIFRSNLISQDIDYYLYMTPPVQKLSGVLLRKTFYDLGCVPRAVFYFKSEKQIKQNILKVGKSTWNK